LTSSLPEPFRAAFAGLEERLPIGQSDSRFHQCFGCGPGQYSGPPGAAHGGIVAAYLDEVLAAAVVRAAGRTAVTGELTVRYVKPVPVETPIIGKGSLVADHGRYVDVEGRLEELGTGAVLATARARFFPIPS